MVSLTATMAGKAGICGDSGQAAIYFGEFFSHPEPHGGVDVEADMAARDLYILDIVVIPPLHRGFPVNHPVGLGEYGCGRHWRRGVEVVVVVAVIRLGVEALL